MVADNHLAIAALLSNPWLTVDQVAEIAGVCSRTVSRVKKRLQDACSENNVELEAYKMLMRKNVPAEKRVEVVRKVLDKVDSNPFAALKAVNYADDVLRLTPKTQPDQQDTDKTKPMFVLPNATNVQVNINTHTPQNALGLGPDAIDVEVEESTE